MSKPYLSIVATARNDNHGGDLLARINIFFSSLFFNLTGRDLDCEIIIVDWNPPYGEKRLAEVLELQNIPKNCLVKFIEVPNSIHKNYKFAKNLPLYQMIAKNVGIRRSSGKFILATNIDLIFSDKIFDLFEQKKLEKGKIYRSIRIDVDKIDYENVSTSKLVEVCKNNIIRYNYIDGTEYRNGKGLNKIYLPKEVAVKGRSFEKEMPRLFTNACGDFQLMHIDDWRKVNGYPELDIFSMHLDSLFEYITYYSGIEEIILEKDLCVYHIEHGNGYTPEAQNKGEFDKRYKKRAVEKLEGEDIRQYAYLMRNRGGFFNEYPNWGLKNERLKMIDYGNDNFQFTIFFSPKSFIGLNKIQQKNAIKSWLNLNPQPEIMILGDDEGYGEIVEEFKLKWVKNIDINKFGTPFVSSIFDKGCDAASNDTVVYINSDIILFNDFTEALRIIRKYNLESYLLVGERINLDIDENIDFNYKENISKLRTLMAESGISQGKRGIDYIVFNKNNFFKIPDFALGRTVWDHWILWKAFETEIPVIDGSNSIKCIHQNHNYNHLKGGFNEVWFGEEAKINEKLSNGRLHRRHIIHSNFRLKVDKIVSTYDDKDIINNYEKLSLPSVNGDIVKFVLSLNSENLKYNQEKIMIEADKLYLKGKYTESYKIYHYLSFIDYGDAIVNVIYMLSNGIGIEKDLRVAEFFWRKLSKLVKISGNNIYGIIFENFDRGITPVHYWIDKYEKGDKTTSSLILSVTFLYGLGEKKDIPESLFWAKRGIEVGYLEIVELLKYYFLSSIISSGELALFIEFLNLYIDSGEEIYILSLIEIHFKFNELAEINLDKLIKTAEHNNIGSVFNYLGLKYYIGIYGEKNKNISKKYFLKGADMGNLLCKDNLNNLVFS